MTLHNVKNGYTLLLNFKPLQSLEIQNVVQHIIRSYVARFL